MTTTRLLLGIPLGLALFVPLFAGAGALRHRLVPSWPRAEALLADLVLVLTALTLVSQLLGTFGWFSLVPLVLTGAAVGTATWFGCRTRPGERAVGDPPRRPPPVRLGPLVTGLAASALALVGGSWLTRTLSALAHGITTVDSNWYHLPMAVRYVQSGHVDAIAVLDPDSVTAYFPGTSSLFHATGILLVRSDILATVVNLGWLAVALLAAHSIGRPFGVGVATALAGTVVLAGPGMVDTQPGGALTDVVGVALLLAMVAFAVQPAPGPRPWAHDLLAALAGGLATGMKFTFLVPVAAVGVALVATAPTGSRVRRLGVVAAAGLASGGYWYARNIVLTGNPLPALDLSIGPLHLRAVEGVANATTVASILDDGEVLRTFILPGLRDAYGPAWFVVLGLAALGAVSALVQGRPPIVRALGVVAVVSTVAFVYNPQYLFGGTFFATNLRYAAPGLTMALVLLPLGAGRLSVALTGLLAGVVVVTQLDPVSWPLWTGESFFSTASRSAATASAAIVTLSAPAVVALVVGLRRRPALGRRAHRVAPGAVLAVPVVVVLGLALVHGRYLDGRYRDFPPMADAYRWASTVQSADIGLYGPFLAMKHPFAGRDLSNRVVFLAVPTPDGGFRPVETCADWIDLIRHQRLDHVVALAVPGQPSGPAGWTADQPDATLLHVFPVNDGTELEVRVFRIDPDAPRACPGREASR